ncbi:MAG: translation initiation factor IF-2 [Candidatus Neomarinimicrobiota bacterium]
MAKRPMRIFQIAKELNISHQEIVTFLKKNGNEITSHMAPVDELIYQQILSEFAKDKEVVERYRKDQVRREIHATRQKEELQSRQHTKILSLDDQRKLEKKELEQDKKDEELAARLKAEAEAAEKARQEAERQRLEQERIEREAAEKAAQLAAAEQAKTEKIAPVKAAVDEKKPKPKPAGPTGDGKKHKLRKINLTDIESKIGISGSKSKGKDKKDKGKPQTVKPSVRDAVRRTLAGIDTRTKKKTYKSRSDRHDQDMDAGDDMVLQIAEFASIDELSKIIGVPANEVIQKCFALGTLATINQRLDWDTIELLTGEFGYKAEQLTEIGEELFSLEESDEDHKQARNRPPVVTVMGHVDHGKTSILDYIRKSNVVAGESGGITQHIGAYKVDVAGGQAITFLDTPGHEAFTAMRARGAQVTDIVVLVVAANDSVMPQTIEAINHAKAASVPIVVAINKIDLPGADIDKVKRELSDRGVQVEDWGGKVQSVLVSAKTGEGIEDLLNSILVEAELLELKANHDCLARGTVVEARLDKGHGAIATVLIQKGTLRVGDPFICNNYSGKVRAIMDERGNRIKKAEPSDAVQILGFDQVPQAADIFAVVEDERELKRIASDRQRLKREIDQKRILTQSLDSMSARIKEGTMKNLPLIIKGDVDGSVEALAGTLEKLNTSEVGVHVVHKAVGMVMESDVFLAATSGAVIIGFQVQVNSNAKLLAKQEGVEIRSYSIIYNVVEDIRLALEGMLEPDSVEEIVGRALVQASFKIPSIGFIAGCKVTEGIMKRNASARLIRDDEVVGTGNISSLKRFKDDAKEVKDGLECGIGLDGVSKYKEGDIIESFIVKKIKRKLEAN